MRTDWRSLGKEEEGVLSVLNRPRLSPISKELHSLVNEVRVRERWCPQSGI